MSFYRRLRRHHIIGFTQTLMLIGILVYVTFSAARILLGDGAAIAVIVGFAGFAVASMENRRVQMPLGSRHVTMYEAPEVLKRLQYLSSRAQLERVPELYVVPSPVANAVTTGGAGNATIVVTTELLRRLNLRELTAVLAHEVAHVRNGDLYIFALSNAIRTVGRMIAGFTLFFLFIAFPVLALTGSFIPPQALLFLAAVPVVGLLTQLAIMRTREFQADLTAVEITDDARGLASALRRLEQPTFTVWDWLVPKTPKRRENTMGELLRSHPDTDERVRRLEGIAGTLIHSRVL